MIRPVPSWLWPTMDALSRVHAPRWFVRYSWSHRWAYRLRDRWYHTIDRRGWR